MSIKDNAKRWAKLYLIDAMGSMAQGLFASLLIGVILQQIFNLITWKPFKPIADLIVKYTAASSPVVGAAIGVAIATALKSRPLTIYSCAVVGAIGYSVAADGVIAGPVGAYLAVCLAATLGNLIAGRSRLDILIVPAACLLSGTLLAVLVGPPIAGFMRYLGDVVNHATRLQPFWMGIAVSAIMSFVLFSPLSSAALSIMLQLSGLAAGAATAGCCASMIGYAAASWRDNKIGGILAQALGTSMLQIGNTIRHPQILIPSTLAAVIVGPLSTLVFRMENNYMGAGMGTSGLVGQITTYATMSGSMSPVLLIVYMVLLHFLIPALISLICYELMYRKGWIKAGYLTLPEI